MVAITTAVTGDHQRAFARADRMRRKVGRGLQLRQREGRAAHRHRGNAISRGNRKRAADHFARVAVERRIRQLVAPVHQGRFVDGGGRSTRRLHRHALRVVGSLDGDGQLRRTLIPVRIRHRVVQRVVRGARRRQRLRRRKAVVQRVAPAAVRVLHQRAKTVERGDRRHVPGTSTPARKLCRLRRRRVRSLGIVAEHIAAQRVARVLGHRATRIVHRQRHVVHHLDCETTGAAEFHGVPVEVRDHQQLGEVDGGHAATAREL